MSVPAKIIYDSFVTRWGEKVAVDFYVYNNDFLVFKKLMDNKKSDYTHYVILPHFVSDEKKANEIINSIPKEKLLLLIKLNLKLKESMLPFMKILRKIFMMHSWRQPTGYQNIIH